MNNAGILDFTPSNLLQRRERDFRVAGNLRPVAFRFFEFIENELVERGVHERGW